MVKKRPLEPVVLAVRRQKINNRNKTKRNETKRKTQRSHGKSKQQKAVGVELRADGGLNWPEKPEWIAGEMKEDVKPWLK